MRISKGELVNHPVRLSIIDALAHGPMTPKQLSECLPKVPQATLYRQISVLLEAEAVEIVSQRQTHGTVESTYALKRGSTHLTREEFAAMSPDDHQHCHALLAAQASSALSRYLERQDYDTTEEGMTYFAAKLFLTNEESRQLRLDLLDLMKRYAKTPNEGGRHQLITISSFPDSKQ